MPLSALGSVPYATGGFGGKLTTDWTQDYARLKPLFRRDPLKTGDWDALLSELENTHYPRAALSACLLEALKNSNAPAPVLEAAQALGQPGVFAVATGQQPELFGGPLYNLYKALTVIKLARELTSRYAGRAKFVPLFWVASDDHDLDEVAHAEFLDAKDQLQRLKLDLPDSMRGSEAQFVSAGKLLDALELPFKNLLSIHGTPDAEKLSAHILETYRKDPLGKAFTKLFTEWLGGQGLIVVEGHAIRPLAAELFAQELERYPQSVAALRKGAEQENAAGYEVQFSEEDVLPHLFVSAQGVRSRLELESNGNFRERSSALSSRGLKPISLSVKEWQSRARNTPEFFSANAAFRSIVQNTCIPVAACVLGPGEMQYWVQLAPLHDEWKTVWPMIVPRASFTLLDSGAQTAQRKLNLALPELFQEKSAMYARVFVGSQQAQLFDSSRAKILDEMDSLHAKVREHDRGLDSMYAKMKARFIHELDRAATKSKASLAQKENAGVARLGHLAAWVKPGGKPQERVLTFAQLLAQYPTLPEELIEHLDPFAFEHRVIAL